MGGLGLSSETWSSLIVSRRLIPKNPFILVFNSNTYIISYLFFIVVSCFFIF